MPMKITYATLSADNEELQASFDTAVELLKLADESGVAPGFALMEQGQQIRWAYLLLGGTALVVALALAPLSLILGIAGVISPDVVRAAGKYGGALSVDGVNAPPVKNNTRRASGSAEGIRR